MSQASLLVDVVKKTLRQQGITYAQVGSKLGLSESSVKRIFSRETLSLERLEQICALAGLEILDLLDLAQASSATRITELSDEQERKLVNEPKLLLVGILAISHWTFEKMLETYRFSESELTGLLTQLDRIGVIDLLPGNRIKVRLARNFSWRKGGPIQRFFEERVQAQFFQSSFLDESELRIMVHGSLSVRSNRLLQQRMRKIAEEFDALVETDRHMDHEAREGTTVVLAIRPWELSLFSELRRQREKPNQAIRLASKPDKAG